MANIAAADVNKLRLQTGVGMMDCKNALVEANGDFEVATDILRKKGQKVASKRADRDAGEGVVIAKTDNSGTFGALIMLNCETDFVAKNAEFVDLSAKILDLALSSKPKTKEDLVNLKLDARTVQEHITDMIGKTGEKMGLGEYQFIEAPLVVSYIHQGSKLSTLVGLNIGDNKDLYQIGREVAMQIAAMSPVALNKDDVDAKIIEKEIEIGKDQARQEGKPEEMLEKIALGKLNKFFKENTLLNQDFIRDPKVTVQQYLTSINKDLTVTSFKRVSLS
jgi:elongation factor Ts